MSDTPDALRAIKFALAIEDHYEMRDFLGAWLKGDTSEWPEFRAALAASDARGGGAVPEELRDDDDLIGRLKQRAAARLSLKKPSDMDRADAKLDRDAATRIGFLAAIERGLQYALESRAAQEEFERKRADAAERRVAELEAALAEARAESAKLKAGCPFDRPDHNLEPEDPCPVCGMTGLPGAEDRCVSNTARLREHTAAGFPTTSARAVEETGANMGGGDHA